MKLTVNQKALGLLFLLTLLGTNYFFSVSLALFSTFFLAYLSKGMRKKSGNRE
jgi:hypothetical protein